MTGLLVTLTPSVPVVVAGLALTCSGVFVAQAATASAMGLAAGPAKGSAAGLYATFYYAGGACGSFVPGLLIWSRPATNHAHWIGDGRPDRLRVRRRPPPVAATAWPPRRVP